MSAVRSPYLRSEVCSNVKFDHGMDHVFSERNKTRHLELRKELAAGYHGKENLHLEAGVDGMVATLAALIEPKADMLGSFQVGATWPEQARGGDRGNSANLTPYPNSMAGSDTTVTALRSTLLLIITSLVVYTKLQQELRTAHSNANALSPRRIISDSDSVSLTPLYLQACIRIQPPSFAMLQKQAAPRGDIPLDGRFIPGGTRVGLCVLGIVHSTAVFGDDA
ncbi:hypothetical protein BJY00DRAFT_317415 [Aspergillus carlsbadensis]|nr:hypothetical protein BJY00DRAFT_317415 [Aspergillus carlsbadensis]